jgi:hypothetical protein
LIETLTLTAGLRDVADPVLQVTIINESRLGKRRLPGDKYTGLAHVRSASTILTKLRWRGENLPVHDSVDQGDRSDGPAGFGLCDGDLAIGAGTSGVFAEPSGSGTFRMWYCAVPQDFLSPSASPTHFPADWRFFP